MATQKDIEAQVSGGKISAEVGHTLKALVARVDVKKRFEEILGKRAPSFISSVVSATQQNKLLAIADPMTVLSSAVMAATLDLPVNASLGFAHLVPYKDNKSGVTRCQFQMGWKGFVQLAMRSGQYKNIGAEKLYDGELRSWNRITGEIDVDLSGKKSDNIVGYVAFFRLINGFEKFFYMTKEEVEKHGKRYSKSYGKDYGPWATNFDAMALKTCIKLLLSKWGILSIEMQRAIGADQGVIQDVDSAQDKESLPQVEFVDASGQGSDEENGTAIEPVEGEVLGAKS